MAARDALHVVELTEEVAAIHLLALCQALDLRGVRQSSEPIRQAHATVREHVPMLDNDRAMDADIDAMLGLIRSDKFRSTECRPATGTPS
jgi:histidine ammonia-lyase